MIQPMRVPNAANASDLRLADFIRLHLEPIVEEWTNFASTRSPASEGMTKLALQDHIVEILKFVADDLETSQSMKEQVAKSKGLGPNDSPFAQSAAEIHAVLRLGDGFDIDQMLSEYRALRASVVKQWLARNQALALTDLEDLTRFNEAIDQAMTESVAEYTRTINHSRNLFLGILGHDLRNPIGAASMAAEIILKIGQLNTKQTTLASHIVTATKRAENILNDLLDITRSTFGIEIPVVRAHMSMEVLAREIVEEMRTLTDLHTFEIIVSGNTEGNWDKARLGQVFSNLLGNAIQYSCSNSIITLSIEERRKQIQFSVHNFGGFIPPEKTSAIFESLTRNPSGGEETVHTTNLGLGLFIAKKIVTGHGGEIGVISHLENGTTFTVLLPKV